MIKLLSSVWALLFGVFLIMIGNGLQASLMGVRGEIEGFSTLELSLITSGYFLGFLAGSKLTPDLIRRVSHVRVFAALGSLISAGLIAFPLVTDPWAWMAIRVLLGFSLSGVYVTSESWLNNAASNETRGTLLSAYMIAQTLGMIAAQGFLSVGDAAGFSLFVLASILVSVSFTPILLSAVPLPAVEKAKRMSLRELYYVSPLGTIGTFILGGVFSAQMGMASVYGAKSGLSLQEISIFIAALFTGSFVFQVPVGWLSDLMDRRILIATLSALGAVACTLGYVMESSFAAVVIAGVIMGGTASPLYSLFIAYTNDYLELDDMPAAASGMVFLYGLGAVFGPLITGQAMEVTSPSAFWVVLSVLFGGIAVFTLWRMTQRVAPESDDSAYVNVLPNSSSVAVGAAYEWYHAEASEEDDPDAETQAS
ncbi:putative MFS-type transporter YcaD [Roseivivax sp. THAF40]|uniref:MFS transporter n=1 Tax=unclassified Roseivivax TaxID=2639302 RepID=UPI001268614E|nr:MULTISPECIES: MFS transporter [unclassified Roseivivax]QFS81727.1 putative MFS-type transporter YcaD [Roseivivax sp. THAF197b]QFT45527.1 putative MFS-type transporter YcaD [Roseivivax sp. THAF40]